MFLDLLLLYLSLVFNLLQVIKEQPYCQQGQSEKFASTGHLRAFLSGLGGLRQRNITQSY